MRHSINLSAFISGDKDTPIFEAKPHTPFTFLLTPHMAPYRVRYAQRGAAIGLP